jgi:hypothetical protein
MEIDQLLEHFVLFNVPDDRSNVILRVDYTFCVVAGALKEINAHSPAAFMKFKTLYDQCLMFDSTVNKTSHLEESK